MDKTMIVTLFSSLYPCWDGEMLASEGASVRDAAELAAKGLLCEDGGRYSLTKARAMELRCTAAENFIDDEPGTAAAIHRASGAAHGGLRLLPRIGGVTVGCI